jgi:DNA-binding MarR family transcriptional regulator
MSELIIESSAGTPGEAARAAAWAEVERGISELYRATRSRVKDMARQFDPPLTPLGFVVLRSIWEQEPVRASSVAAALCLDKSILSRQIVALREARLVECQPDPDDRRATLLVPSATARETIERLSRRSRDEYHRALNSWTTREMATFARLLEKFNQLTDWAAVMTNVKADVDQRREF